MLVEVLDEALRVERYCGFAEDSGAGALVTFTGVTRDVFEGKRVLRLEYEAYVPMVRPFSAPCVSNSFLCAWCIYAATVLRGRH